MFKIFSIYGELFKKKWKFYLLTILIFIGLFFCSYKVQKIQSNIQDSILNIVSILFPLIAGFLTFGREIMKDINERILAIKAVEESRTGRPTPDVKKRDITKLKSLASNFKSVVINTFFISFSLIIFVLVSKFNSYDFKTEFFKGDKNVFYEYAVNNGLSFVIKLMFFIVLTLLFLNLSYLVYFIVKVNQHDEESDNKELLNQEN
jgi:preprotein translocase subunit SecG/multidrug transporter EmrE-like cation transporter